MDQKAEFKTHLIKLEELIEKFEHHDKFDQFQGSIIEIKENHESFQSQHKIDFDSINSRLHNLIRLYEELSSQGNLTEQHSLESEIKSQNEKIEQLSNQLNNMASESTKARHNLKAELGYLEEGLKEIDNNKGKLKKVEAKLRLTPDQNALNNINRKIEEEAKRHQTLSKRYLYAERIVTVTLLVMWLILLGIISILVF